jgi:hypothetical protein
MVIFLQTVVCWLKTNKGKEYFHSSAVFYILGEENKYVTTSFMMMHD